MAFGDKPGRHLGSEGSTLLLKSDPGVHHNCLVETGIFCDFLGRRCSDPTVLSRGVHAG